MEREEEEKKRKNLETNSIRVSHEATFKIRAKPLPLPLPKTQWYALRLPLIGQLFAKCQTHRFTKGLLPNAQCSGNGPTAI